MFPCKAGATIQWKGKMLYPSPFKNVFLFPLVFTFFSEGLRIDELLYLGMANSFMVKYWDWRVAVMAVGSHLL